MIRKKKLFCVFKIELFNVYFYGGYNKCIGYILKLFKNVNIELFNS